MATQTSLVAQQVRLQQWQSRSATAKVDRREWMLKPGVPRIILQKQTITTVFVVSVKYV